MNFSLRNCYQNVTFILCLLTASSYGITSAVTYSFSGGRFGDNLLAYCHAKWIAYKYKIPLLYKPFEYSDQLMMHELEMPYSTELEWQFEQVIICSCPDFTIDTESGCLYVIPFFPESIFNRSDEAFPFLFFVDWQDPAFKVLLNTMICALKAIKVPVVPPDHLTVAVHVRKGTGWDIPNYGITPLQLSASHPLRFAPDSFYIEQLKKIARIFPEDAIYVYLFTDHDNPGELAKKYEQNVQCDRMVFDYRMSDNNEFINVLDDFFALTSFDCLIRPDSNFSFMASRLGNYKVQIAPWHGVIIDGNRVFIDEINLEIEGESFIVKEQREELHP